MFYLEKPHKDWSLLLQTLAGSASNSRIRLWRLNIHQMFGRNKEVYVSSIDVEAKDALYALTEYLSHQWENAEIALNFGVCRRGLFTNVRKAFKIQIEDELALRLLLSSRTEAYAHIKHFAESVSEEELYVLAEKNSF